MRAYRNTPALARHAGMSHLGRKVLCAFIACALTVVLLGEVAKSASQAAQRAATEESLNDRAVAIGKGAAARPVERRMPLI